MNVSAFFLEPFFNPFAEPGWSSLKTVFHDDGIRLLLQKPDDEMRAAFCAAPPPRRFLRFNGGSGADATDEVAARCAEGAQP